MFNKPSIMYSVEKEQYANKNIHTYMHVRDGLFKIFLTYRRKLEPDKPKRNIKGFD